MLLSKIFKTKTHREIDDKIKNNQDLSSTEKKYISEENSDIGLGMFTTGLISAIGTGVVLATGAAVLPGLRAVGIRAVGAGILARFGNHLSKDKYFLNNQKKNEERIKYENQNNMSLR